METVVKMALLLADDIRLDRVETIKVIGKDDTINGLQFSVPDEEARISDH